jgi:hypothetical protein
MTRLMYDSTTASAIPTNAAMVAGYCDGLYVWSEADWNRFPNAVKVRIAVKPYTNDGHALDVEPGNWNAAASVDWVLLRRSAGMVPTVYCGSWAPGYTWEDVLAAHAARGVPPPLIWYANYDGVKVVPAGAVAKQYADAGPYDLSVVEDYWPGVDVAPVPVPVPKPAPGPVQNPVPEPDIPSAQGRLDTFDTMIDSYAQASHEMIQGIREDLNT